MLNKTASMLAAITSFVHVFIGGKDVLSPMLKSNLPFEVEGAMHACWHIVSCILIWSTIVFWRGGKTAFHFGLIWLACAVLFIYLGLSELGLQGLIVLPQWTILGLAGLLTVFKNQSHNALSYNY